MAPWTGFLSLEPIGNGIPLWFKPRTRRTLREFRKIMRGIWLLLSWAPTPEPHSLPDDCRLEHVPVDTKHWTPNMPRGHESL
jgi:hypothetical protein